MSQHVRVLRLTLILSSIVGTPAFAQQPAALKIHLIGVGEYEPAKSLAEFKKLLEKDYRVICTASLGGNGKKLDNLDSLKSADVLVLFARRMNLPDEQMAILRDHWEKGKPIVALRTASHAFQQADIDAFGKVLGGDYKGPGSYTAPFKAIAADTQKDHPILRGVGAINSRGCYNFGKLADKAVVLQVVESDRKIKAPATWVHEYKGGRMFYSTMGAPEDFQNENFRRLLLNAICWTARRDPETIALKAKEKVDGDTRTPREVAEQLAGVYGNKLDQVAYIPALPLVAKLRLSELTGDPKHAEKVNTIVAPFLRGEKSPVPKSGSEQAGHLIFAELASRAQGKDRERWTLLCRAAADQIFGKDKKPLSIMPFHSEMSDAVFMAGPILAATGKLTGERKYFDAAATHFASMRKLCLRTDGLYRHSPLCEAAWGRGNGFPALGLALALSNWPDDHPARMDLVIEFQKHMKSLKPHQDAKTGCWHQVIDHPKSYDEYSCTCMIGFAMQRGITRGWLAKADYQPCVDLAWRAIKERTSPDGKLVNVCTGTGKQRTLQDYFDRPAINGRDDRGGAMGLLFATELMAAK